MKLRNPLLLWFVGVTFALTPTTVLAQQSSSPPALAGSLSSTDPVFRDGRSYDAKTFFGRAGQEVAIILDSAQFDPVMWIEDSAGNVIAYNDDANESTRTAVIQTVLPHTGNYVALFTSYNNTSSRGNYRYAFGLSNNSSTAASSAPSTNRTPDGSTAADWAALGILGAGLLWWMTSGSGEAAPRENICPYTQPDGSRGWYEC